MICGRRKKEVRGGKIVRFYADVNIYLLGQQDCTIAPRSGILHNCRKLISDRLLSRRITTSIGNSEGTTHANS